VLFFFISRSPLYCALSASIIGSVSHPAETGLLIPSVKRDYRNVAGPFGIRDEGASDL
jgi:hypothetical protein